MEEEGGGGGGEVNWEENGRGGGGRERLDSKIVFFADQRRSEVLQEKLLPVFFVALFLHQWRGLKP